MKTKLFSKTSLLVSLKGIGSSLASYICALPLWLLTMFFIRKDWIVIGSIFGLISFVVSFLFFGFFSSRWWRWN
jgi:hypothetical protein